MGNKLEKIIEYGLYLFVFLLPWQTRWIWRGGELNGGVWEYGSMSLYATEILLIAILVLVGIWFLKTNLSLVSGRLSLIWLIVAFFELVVFISIFWAVDKPLALYGWWRVILGIGLFWLVTALPLSIKKISIAFLSSAAVQSVFGIWQFFAQTTFANKWLGLALHPVSVGGTFVVENSAGRFLRAYGSLPHPNMLGGFLAIAILISIGLYLTSRRKNILSLTTHYSLLTTFSAGLFFTFSRGAWLSLFLGLAALVVFTLFQKKRLLKIFKPIILLTIVFLILGSLFSDLVMTRFGGSERLEVISGAERIEYMSDAKNLLDDYWPSGAGVNNYTLAVYKNIDSSRPVWKYQPVHNIYLLIWSELGLAGIFIFLFLIGYVIRLTAYGLRLTADVFLPIFFMTLVSLLIIGLFDHYLWTLYFGIMLWWLVLGLWYRTILNAKVAITLNYETKK